MKHHCNYFFVPELVNIEPGLFELFENVASVRFFGTHCRCKSLRSDPNVTNNTIITLTPNYNNKNIT